MKHFVISAAVLLSACCSATQEATPQQERLNRYCSLSQGGTTVISSYTKENEINKNFYYLTGVDSPEATLVIDGDSKSATIYTDSGIEPGYYKVEPASKLASQIEGCSDIVAPALADSIIFDMRMVKDASEIAMLKTACQNTGIGIADMLKKIESGHTEQQMDSMMQAAFDALGANGVSFHLAASGENATSVHAYTSSYVMQAGDMAVIDIGACEDRYTADISRSFPVNGKFTKEQSDIYNIVLLAQKEGMTKILPGGDMDASEAYAREVIIDELAKLGLVTDKDSKWQRKIYIQHGFSHHIGLDIHDVWVWFKKTYKEGERVYQPGMIVTFEPGLYFPADYLRNTTDKMRAEVGDKEIDAFLAKVEPIYNRYKSIGIRIEDCILVTQDGQEVITTDCPKEIEEVELLMAQN